MRIFHQGQFLLQRINPTRNFDHWPVGVLMLLIVSCFFHWSCTTLKETKSIPLKAPLTVKPVENFGLLDHEGKFQELYYYSDQKAVVFIVQGNGCPILRQSLPYLKKLKAQFEPQGVKFLMINPNPQDDRASMVAEARSFDIDVPILEDKSQLITQSLGLTRTSEVAVIETTNWNIVYRGAISDQFGYDINKGKIEWPYLQDVLEVLLKSEAIPWNQTTAKGCLINYQKIHPVNFAHDVAPILKEHCVMCHHAGGIAPWSMDSYEKVKGWGAMIGEVVRTRRMPPWQADPYYGKFRDDFSLSPQEARTLLEWIEQGFPKGEGTDPLAQKAPAEKVLWGLGDPELIFTMAQVQSIPAAGKDQFRTVASDKPVERDLWIRAIEIRPGNYQVVHHCNVFVEPPDWNQPNPQGFNDEKDSRTMEEWYHRSGFNQEGGQTIAGYSPGGNVFVLHEKTGMFIPQGSKIKFRIHYVPTGKPETDQTKVGLYLHKERPAHILSFAVVNNRDIKIPPGVKEYRVSSCHMGAKDCTFDKEILLTTLQPHMHLRGKAMKFILEYPDGRSEILLSVPHYKFRWQRIYVLAEPKRIPVGSKLLVEGTYDNSAQNPDNPDPNQEVHFGPQSDAEMFTGIFSYIDPSEIQK